MNPYQKKVLASYTCLILDLNPNMEEYLQSHGIPKEIIAKMTTAFNIIHRVNQLCFKEDNVTHLSHKKNKVYSLEQASEWLKNNTIGKQNPLTCIRGKYKTVANTRDKAIGFYYLTVEDLDKLSKPKV